MASSTEHYKGNTLNNILDSKIYENRCNKKKIYTNPDNRCIIQVFVINFF